MDTPRREIPLNMSSRFTTTYIGRCALRNPHVMAPMTCVRSDGESGAVGKVDGTLGQASAGLLEHRFVAGSGHAARFSVSHMVQGQVHLGDDVKAVQDNQDVGAGS
jgi:hypothetical protein